jgi:acyl transferase domain-containing protein
LIALAKDLLEKRPTEERWAAPQGIFFGSGEQTGKLAVIFPGQGAQYPGMLKDLACLFPQFLDVLTTADGCFDGEKRLSDLIYPQPAFDDASRGLQLEVLRATDVAQPAIGAVSLGALRVLEYFGLKAEAAAGHSYGELVALCAAGRIEPDDFHRLSRTRGELMAGRKGDAGSMIAITADMKTVEAFLADHDLGLVVANRNSPRQMVLSGPTAEIDRAESLLEEAGFSGKRLKVAAAFHSELMTHATEAFGEALADVEFGEARLPVYANTTAEPYPEQQEAERWLLAGQLTAPVEFARSVENIFASGVRTFVEIGPGARLSALVEETLAGRDVVTTAIDASSGRRNGQADLARTLAQLAARGVELSLTRWDEGALAEYDAFLALKKPALTIRVNGANAKPSAQTRPATKRMPSPVPVETVTTIAAPVTGRLDSSRKSLEALVRLQEQTARVHQQFLEGQDRRQRLFRR